MKKLLALLLLAAAPLAAQHVVDQKTFDAIASEYSGERAQELIRRIVEHHRIQGSPMMHAAATDVVAASLRAAGLEPEIETFLSDGRTKYGTWTSPIGWTMRGGELWLEGETPVRLCRYADVPMCVSTYSKGGTFSGELIDAGNGTRDADYEGKDVRGKVVLASGYARDVVRKAVIERGAVGTLIYPPANDRPDHPDMVRYHGLWTRAEDVDRTSGSFQISARQYAMLKARMASGPVRVRGTIDADLGPGQLTLVHARIRGSERPEEEVIVVAHLDHPKWSANDNASGSAALVELARTLQTLIASGKLPAPKKSIHFMWVPEWYGTMAWLMKHHEARACGAWYDPRPRSDAKGCVVAAINMDMVGEDTVKTNGRFYITRSPLSVPSFLDALLADLLEQTREANLYAPAGTRNYWPAEMVDYFQGSDHDMFLGVGVPSTMLGHDPDWTHHTSEDTPDKTDASELRRVGTLAANAAYWIGAAGPREWESLAPAVVAEKLRRDSQAMVTMKRIGNERLAARLQKSLEAALRNFAPPQPAPAKNGPRRAALAPVHSELYEEATGEERKWYDAQRSMPNLGLALYEVVNLADGTRTTAEIADLLTIESGRPVSTEWVEGAVRFLRSLKVLE